MKQRYLFALLIVVAFLSCKKEEDLKAPIPAYLEIDDISVSTSSPIQGSANDKISDAWVFVNNQLIGAFELPTQIPIQTTGQINLKIRGGIFNNGMSNDRKIYPFYDFYELDTLLQPEQVLKINPAVPYKSSAVFDVPWSGENFESGVNFVQNPNSQATLVRNTASGIFEGFASGYAKLESNETFFEVYTPTFSSVAPSGTDVYLEMNYKCTHDIVVSIYTDNRQFQNSVLVLRARSEWNKIYIDFSNVFSTLFAATNYNIAIGFTTGLGETGEIHLDNIKLVHY